MEWIFLLVILMMLLSINSKLDDFKEKGLTDSVTKAIKNKNRLKFPLKDYVGKKVYLIISNDEINNSYEFSVMGSIQGTITDYDEEWIEFTYTMKNKEIIQYFRIRDIESIDEKNSGGKE